MTDASAPPVSILVVDDESSILDMLVMAVEELGFVAYTATNGREGLTLAQQYRPTLVVSDVMMPYVDGFALTRAIRADPTLDHTKVILISAVNTISSDVGADAYLRKPFELDDLEDTIQRLVRGALT